VLSLLGESLYFNTYYPPTRVTIFSKATPLFLPHALMPSTLSNPSFAIFRPATTFSLYNPPFGSPRLGKFQRAIGFCNIFAPNYLLKFPATPFTLVMRHFLPLQGGPMTAFKLSAVGLPTHSKSIFEKTRFSSKPYFMVRHFLSILRPENSFHLTQIFTTFLSSSSSHIHIFYRSSFPCQHVFWTSPACAATLLHTTHSLAPKPISFSLDYCLYKTNR
jgi:hypothetical protein